MKHYSIISDCCYLIKKYRKNFPSALILATIQIVLTITGSVMVIFLPKFAVDIATGESNMGLGEFITFCLFYILVGTVCAGSDAKKYLYMSRIRMLFLGELFLKSLKLPYEQGEHGAQKENYWEAASSLSRGDFSSASRMSFAMLEIIINGLSFFVCASFIGVLNFRLCSDLLFYL